MKIYLDMDGVIANFERRYIELFREHPGTSRDRKEFSKNWTLFIEGKNFESLDYWPGGPELIKYLIYRFNDVEIIKRACNLINDNQLAIDFENRNRLYLTSSLSVSS